MSFSNVGISVEVAKSVNNNCFGILFIYIELQLKNIS